MKPKNKRQPRPERPARKKAARKSKTVKRASPAGKARFAAESAEAAAAPTRKSKKRRAKRARKQAQGESIQPDGLETDADVASEAFELGLGSRVVPPNLRYSEPLESTPPASTHSRGDLEAQIAALEARLDGLIRHGKAEQDTDHPVEADDSASARKLALAESTALDSEAASAEYFTRTWSRSSLREQSEAFDDFGLDPLFESRVRPVLEFLYKSYFRAQVAGIEHIPSEGRCVVVANHSGTLPLDGAMLRTALRLEHARHRDLRWLAEDFVYYLPFAGVFMNRVGAVRACPENAERLLAQDNLVAVFPEGLHGIKKLFKDRYQLQRFGRGGYIRLCLRMQAPIVPCAIIGAEESSPLLYRIESLSELIGLPYLPITPTFPWLGPLGLLPAPSKWKIRFGEPISLDSYGPEAADDHVLVGRLSERVRSSIQSMLDGGLRERKSVWFG
ncbi:MAG TPA: lysophospholipid acyltransferase family protein [Polyangiaceae bacterium]